MSTTPTPVGAPSRRGTHESTGPKTKPLYTIRRPAGRAAAVFNATTTNPNSGFGRTG